MPAIETFEQRFTNPRGYRRFRSFPVISAPGRKKRTRTARQWHQDREAAVQDENTAIGREIEKRLGVPVMISATGPEKNPRYKLIPLPGLDPKKVIRYKSSGRFLFPVFRNIRTRRAAPLPGTSLGDTSYADDSGDIYLGGFISVIKGVASQVKTFAKKAIHPIRTIRARRDPLKKGIREMQKRGLSPVKGAVKTNSGKTIMGDLLTLDNLAMAKNIFPTADMAATYQDLVDNGQYVEAADMAEAVQPGAFGGTTTPPAPGGMPGWLLPAGIIGGLYFAYKKKMI